MTAFLLPAIIRILMGLCSGYLAKVGIDESAQQSLTSVLSGGGGAGYLVTSAITLVVPTIWAHFSNTAAAIIDKAVHVSGGSASPLAAAAPAAKGSAGVSGYENALKTFTSGFKL